jgi:dimethylglycine dehydrogenase
MSGSIASSAAGCPNRGRIALTWTLNSKGGILSEFTITRLAPTRLLLISAAAAEWHDIDGLKKHLPADGSVRVENVTTRYGSLILAGPRARYVLSKITDSDLSNAGFPWLSAREIEIGYSRMLALRVNYVGELGWELHAPTEHMDATYSALWRAGEEHGIRDFGMYAMDSLRLEKGYRGWKVDLTHEYTPLMASLDRFVAFDMPDFIGKAALLKEQEAGPKERLVSLVMSEAGEADAPYCSPVLRQGEIVGLTVSSGYGHAIQKAIALAYGPERPRKAGNRARGRDSRTARGRARGGRTALRSNQREAARIVPFKRPAAASRRDRSADSRTAHTVCVWLRPHARNPPSSAGSALQP